MRLFWVKFKHNKNAFRMARFEYKEFIIIYKAKIAARGVILSLNVLLIDRLTR